MALGLLGLAVVFTMLVTGWVALAIAVLAAYLLLTGMLSRDPIYLLLGINTRTAHLRSKVGKTLQRMNK